MVLYRFPAALDLKQPKEKKKITKDQHHSDIDIAREKQKEIEMILYCKKEFNYLNQPLLRQTKLVCEKYLSGLLRTDQTEGIEN